MKINVSTQVLVINANKKNEQRHRCFFLIFFLFLCSCQTHHTIESQVTCIATPETVNTLPSCFQPLSDKELSQDWAKELLIGNSFARETDFYRAITSYKRALILGCSDAYRKKQIEFGIIECYYLGKKYQEAVDFFETSLIKESPKGFSALRELLILIYDSYQWIGQKERAEYILDLIKKNDPETAIKLQASTALSKADFNTLNNLSTQFTNHCDLLHSYASKKKSVKTAQTLNAFIPGAGYLYVGQKQTALTSFLINSLFVAAAYHFFSHGNPAAGIITTSLEMGWYFGGIHGAGLAAKAYNEQLYQSSAHEFMMKNSLFPILMFQCSF